MLSEVDSVRESVAPYDWDRRSGTRRFSKPEMLLVLGVRTTQPEAKEEVAGDEAGWMGRFVAISIRGSLAANIAAIGWPWSSTAQPPGGFDGGLSQRSKSDHSGASSCCDGCCAAASVRRRSDAVAWYP